MRSELKIDLPLRALFAQVLFHTFFFRFPPSFRKPPQWILENITVEKLAAMADGLSAMEMHEDVSEGLVPSRKYT
jgi:hypothetical protein